MKERGIKVGKSAMGDSSAGEMQMGKGDKKLQVTRDSGSRFM